MTHEELKNIYSNPPADFHNAVLSSLCRLDSKAPVRRKNRRALRIALVCAIVAALGSFTAVAASTKMFGLLAEPNGKYGLNISVESKAEETSAKPVKYMRPIFGYMPSGYEVVPNTDNMKYSQPEDDGAGFSFMVCPADKYEASEQYVVETEQTSANGNKLIIATCQRTKGGDVHYTATCFFEKDDYVVWCIAHHGAPKTELKKIFENITLEEYTPDYIPEDITYSELDERRMNYEKKQNSIITAHKIGESFKWQDYTIKVTSVDELEGRQDIPEEYFNWITDFLVDYDDYFDGNGGFISSYTRRNWTFGDGIHTQDTYTDEKATRRLLNATVEVTRNAENDESSFDVMNINAVIFLNDGGKLKENDDTIHGNAEVVCTTPGDEANVLHMSKGETRTLTIGLAVDDSVLDNAYLTLCTQNTNEVIDDEAQTISFDTHFDCVKIKD